MSENAIRKKLLQRARSQYLPRGLRRKLADHFFLSLKGIDHRLNRGHPETVRKAKELIQEELRQIESKLKKPKSQRALLRYAQASYKKAAEKIDQLPLFETAPEEADVEQTSQGEPN